MGKKTSKTSQTTTLPAWAQNLATGAGNQILNTVSGNQGNLQNIANSISGQLPGLASKAFGNQPGIQQGTNYATSVLGGKYLTGNPYVEGMVHAAEQDAGNAVNSTFSQYGRTGGGNNIEALARGVAEAGNNVRFQNYQNERGLQSQALGALPGLVSAQYAGIPAYLGAAQAAGTLPYAGISNLGQIGSLYGGAGTTTGTQPGGWGTALLGGLSNMFSFSPIKLSDRRLKTNIVLVRRDPDGLGWYDWNWRSDPNGPTEHGVIADEVKALRPWAYVSNYREGYDGVNYAKLRRAA